MTIHLYGPLAVLSDSHLWLASFHPDASDDPTTLLEDLSYAQLDTRDLQRWNRFRPLDKKRQFLKSRVAVRTVLERELGAEAQCLFLRTNLRGRPFLHDNKGQERYQISLSHSGPLIAIVFSTGSASVGVDIENVQQIRKTALQNVTLRNEELEWMQRTGVSGNLGALLSVWTVKEAVWKALGGPESVTAANFTTHYDSEGAISCVLDGEKEGNKIQVTLFGPPAACPFSPLNWVPIKDDVFSNVSFLGCVAQK